MKTPKVSVIIPVYNAEQYLKQCLDSVREQTFSDIELICVDDGSVDSSHEILEAYAKDDNRIRIIKSANNGALKARNIGISASSGKYIMFMDADDFIDKRTIEYAYLSATKESADIVVFGGETFPTVSWASKNLKTNSCVCTDPIDALFHEKGSRPFMWNKLFDRTLFDNEFFRNDDTYDLTIGLDQPVIFTVFPRAKKVVFIPDKFYFYRQDTENSIMHKYGQNNKKVFGHIKTAKCVFEIWLKNGFIENHEEDFLNWCFVYIYQTFQDLPFDLEIYAAKKTAELLDAYKDFLSKKNRKQYEQLKAISLIDLNNPHVSVIIPVYNSECYLDQCIQSLQKQTSRNFEMIFVDDGSTDESLKIIEKYANTDSRIRILKQNHEFAGAARNKGISAAKGKYLLFLDSDDFFESTLIEDSFATAEASEVDICLFKAKEYNQTNGITTPMPWTCRVEVLPKGVFSPHDIADNVFSCTTAVPWTKLFNRQFIIDENIKFQNIRSANDVLFVYSAIISAKKITVLNKSLVFYRTHFETSLQATKDKEPLAFYSAQMALKFYIEAQNKMAEFYHNFIELAACRCLYNLETLKDYGKFCEVYFFLRNEAFVELEIIDKGDDFFTKYKSNHIAQKKNDVMNISPLEYIIKWKIGFPKNVSVQKKTSNSDSKELALIRASYSYRIGRFITFIPRKVRGVIRCYRDHGMRYTLREIKKKIGSLLKK